MISRGCRSRRAVPLAAVAALVSLSGWAGCGGSSTSSPTPPASPSTPTAPETTDCTGLWTVYQGDPRHRAQSSLSGPSSTPQAQAAFAAAGGVRGGPVLGGDCTVYALGIAQGGEDSVLSAIRGLTVQWQATVSGPAASSPAVGASGTVYVHGHHSLYAFDPEGNPLWTLELADGFVQTESSSPVIGPDGTIYVGTFNGERIFAVNPDGGLRWSTHVGRTYATPALGDDGSIYIGADGLVCLRSDGSIRWRARVDGYLHASPTIGPDGTVYVASLSGTLYAFTPDGQTIWTVALGDGSWNTPALSTDGVLYILSGYFSGRALLHALRADGSEVWRHDFGPQEYNQMAAPTIGADGTVFVSTASALHALSPDGLLLWSFSTSGSSGPVLIAPDRTLYVGQALQAVR